MESNKGIKEIMDHNVCYFVKMMSHQEEWRKPWLFQLFCEDIDKVFVRVQFEPQFLK